MLALTFTCCWPTSGVFFAGICLRFLVVGCREDPTDSRKAQQINLIGKNILQQDASVFRRPEPILSGMLHELPAHP